MEELPVELVGKILSHIAAARDVLLASATCRKWRRAFREHLSALSFERSDFYGVGYGTALYRKREDHNTTAGDVEIMITGTILQTTGLRSLTIAGGEFGKFSPSVVVGWLLHVRKSLLEFTCDFDCGPVLDVAHICRCEKLEKLSLLMNAIKYVDQKSYAFTSLRSLYLHTAEISEQDLNALLSACPKLEKLELRSLDLSEDPRVKLEVRAPNLREFVMAGVSLDKLTVESDIIEHLEFIYCSLEFFKVILKGSSLRKIRMYCTTAAHLEISGSVENLETVDIHRSRVPQSEFYLLLLKSSKLRVIRLWDSVLTEAIDLEMIAIGCPQLSCLDLYCRINEDDEQFPYCLPGPTPFQNVGTLNFWWSNSNTNADKLCELCDFIESLLERCPRLKKVTLGGPKEQVMARRNRPLSRIKRKCTGLNVQFAFSEDTYRLFFGGL